MLILQLTLSTLLLGSIQAGSLKIHEFNIPEALMDTPFAEFLDNIFNQDRIVGGSEVVPHSLPFQISFQSSGGGHFCGGSVYNENWVVTAAHCCGRRSASSVRVAAGKHDIRTSESNQQIVGVSRIVKHPGWNSGTTNNDICLLKLSRPLNLNNYVQSLALAASSDDFESNAVVSGWGTTSSGGYISRKLLKVSVPLVSDRSCSNSYGHSFIAGTMICAGTSGRDSCQGDSGGPLTCQTRDGRRVLCGVVSWGYGCAARGYPGVYANVKHFTNWVEQTVNYYKNNVEAEEVIEEEIVEEADIVSYLGNLPYVKDILNYTNSLFKRMFAFGQ